jgi:hypothetical protein
MSMRTDCCHYQTRTYANGESARYCTLDLAPEAPWRCPADCHGYERLLIDVGFDPGTLVPPPLGAEPEGDPEAIAAVLDEAEDIVNAAAPDILAELEPRSPGRRRWFDRFRRGGDPRPPQSNR